MLSARLKFRLHLAGGALALIGILFVSARLISHAAEINLAVFNEAAWAVAILALIYGLSNLMLAQAWRKVLQHFGVSVAASWAIWAYGISQIAKYIPGNIFQLAGRQALAAAAGLPHWPLAKSAAWELGLIATASAMFGLLILPVLTEYVTHATSLALFFATFGVTLFALKHVSSKAVVLALLWYFGFLVLSGIIFVGLIELISEHSALEVADWLPLISAYVLAWLAGLVTPGAPAGIGIRELILLLLLNGIIGETELITAVAVGRLVTISGDGLFFIASFVYGNRYFH